MRSALLVLVLLLPGPQHVGAQVATPAPEPEPKKEKSADRSTGLPHWIDWTFNFDASWGTFGFANSLFQNPREGVKEDLSDQWFEGYVKPALSGSHRLTSSSEL